ncbi:MAG: response regulator [bacterium]|nr:response regulator [bacterium]
MEKETILIVDDEPDLTELIKTVLQKKRYKTLVAENGIRALELAQKHIPTLILLDIMMPELDGFAVCQKLRDNFYTSHIPIIVLTCREELENKVKGFAIGADDYVTKPFNFSELIARIKAVLRRTHKERSSNPLTQLPGGNLIEDQVKKRLKLNTHSAFLYMDLDEFKAYNDYYGYKKGDEVIKKLAEIICNAVDEYGNKDDFVGHVGGDDFIFITTPDKPKIIADQIIKNLEEISVKFYDDRDLKNGYIEIKNRRGISNKYSTKLTITIVGISNQDVSIKSHIQVSDSLAEVKRYLKRNEGSNFMMERRIHAE